jgi:hypothetical protein
MIIGWSSTKFLFVMPIGNPRWLPPQVIHVVLTQAPYIGSNVKLPYSPNGKRNIRDPFKENIDSSRTVAMIQRGP